MLRQFLAPTDDDFRLLLGQMALTLRASSSWACTGSCTCACVCNCNCDCKCGQRSETEGDGIWDLPQGVELRTADCFQRQSP